MVSVCTVPARGGRSCEHFGGYKTINRIPLLNLMKNYGVWVEKLGVKLHTFHIMPHVTTHNGGYIPL